MTTRGLRTRAVYAAWLAATRPARRRFERALAAPDRAQERLLRSILRDNADTEVGRRAGFARLRTLEEYRRAVPVRGWDELLPEIDAVRRGRQGVLTREPVTRLVPSGGSAGPCKLVPFTRSLGASFAAAVAPWVADLAARHPSLTRGPAYWSVSPAMDGPPLAAAVPIGFESDTRYLGRVLAPLVGRTLVAPDALRHARPLESFQYLTLRLLLAARSLRLLSIWHPSFLALVLGRRDAWWDRLVDDVRRGTLSPPQPVAADVADAVRRRCRKDAARADELRRLGAGAPVAELWPELCVVSAWGDAAAAEPFAALRELCRPVAVEAKGLLATEACVTIPYADRHPLALDSTFVELVGEDGRARGPGEVRVGECHDLVLTTRGGLYRYRIGDRVRVDGMLGATPSLRLVGRTDHVVDRVGEKLSDVFVGAAIARAYDGEPLPPFAMLGAEGGGYALFVDRPPRDAPALASRLAAALRKSPGFAYAQDLGQLGPVRIVLCPSGSSAAWLARRHAQGRGLGDVKPARLADEDAWTAILEGHEIARLPLPASAGCGLAGRNP